MVFMVTMQKRFYYFDILEISKSPNTTPNLKILELRIHELVGGGGGVGGWVHLDNAVESKIMKG